MATGKEMSQTVQSKRGPYRWLRDTVIGCPETPTVF
jgi:hypothetical protein